MINSVNQHIALPMGSSRAPVSIQEILYLFRVLCGSQHCTGHFRMGSWDGRRNQYIQLVKVLYYKLPTNGKQLPAFPLEVGLGTEPRSQRWKARVLPLCHHGPKKYCKSVQILCWPLHETYNLVLILDCILWALVRTK